MDAAKWNTIKDSFSEAAELSPQKRIAYLASLDRDTRGQVERLLAADPDASGFIAEPFLIEQGSVTKGNGFAAPHADRRLRFARNDRVGRDGNGIFGGTRGRWL